MSKKDTTYFTLDAHNLPQALPESLARLDNMADEAIDYSDTPELDDRFWQNAKLLRPVPKKMISLRVDEDVLAWFRAQGKGYQGYMNAILRAYHEAHSGQA